MRQRAQRAGVICQDRMGEGVCCGSARRPRAAGGGAGGTAGGTWVVDDGRWMGTVEWYRNRGRGGDDAQHPAGREASRRARRANWAAQTGWPCRLAAMHAASIRRSSCATRSGGGGGDGGYNSRRRAGRRATSPSSRPSSRPSARPSTRPSTQHASQSTTAPFVQAGAPGRTQETRLVSHGKNSSSSSSAGGYPLHSPRRAASNSNKGAAGRARAAARRRPGLLPLL